MMKSTISKSVLALKFVIKRIYQTWIEFCEPVIKTMPI